MSYYERLTLLNQSSFSCRTRTDLILLYKILHGLIIDSKVKSLFVLNDNTVHNLRGHMHAFKLIIPEPRTNLLKYNYVYQVDKCWISLPANICESASL